MAQSLSRRSTRGLRLQVYQPWLRNHTAIAVAFVALVEPLPSTLTPRVLIWDFLTGVLPSDKTI